MIRMLAKAIFTVLVIQWLHNEALMVAPGLKPMSEGLRSIVRIPTHDKWEAISEAVAQHKDLFVKKQADAPLRISRLSAAFVNSDRD